MKHIACLIIALFAASAFAAVPEPGGTDIPYGIPSGEGLNPQRFGPVTSPNPDGTALDPGRCRPPESSDTKAIPMDQIGAEAGKQYKGDGLSVTATEGGALVRCLFQRLEGKITETGLTLYSTIDDASTAGFQVKATTLGRTAPGGPGAPSHGLSPTGRVVVENNLARWIRPGVVEEYSASMDGVRQDFVVLERPSGMGELRVELALTGGTAGTTPDGAQIVLDGSGRKLGYNRLNVTDAEGKTVPARIEVADANRLAIIADDANAVYPLRIDPTFSDANWISMGGLPGANAMIWAIAIDTNAGVVYAGGDFTGIGGVTANHIAKWNGSVWSALGSGLDSRVYSLAMDANSNLYVGGYFTAAGGVEANYIAKWNGSAWSALGSGMNNWVWALSIDSGGSLYAGGVFTTAGGGAANGVAKWNGTSWSALGSGVDGGIADLISDGSGNLYAGGGFTTAGGIAANNIAKWNGSAWSALGSGVNGSVWSLARDSSGNLYAGGYFGTAGGNAANSIAKWNGSTWSALGSGLDNTVHALAFDSSGNLYVGGEFFSAGGKAANYIAKWNGSSWSAIGSGLDRYVYALAMDGSGNLYAGGEFTVAGGSSANYITKWSGSSWSALGSGINSGVSSLALDGSGNLYVGGTFTTVGGVSANRIAKWDGSSWTALGSGVNSRVWALALDVLGNVYAGGEFTTAGGVSANRIAKWNGSSWSPLGSGMNGEVDALLVDGSGNLYAGGGFTTANGASANFIAKWNGSSWSALGSGMNAWVLALAFDGLGNLYAGGGFTTADGLTVNRIAKWDGSSWSALGSGMNSDVHTLAVDGSGNLFVGGEFTMAGGVSANLIAKWNGSSWSSLGSGMNDYFHVAALAVDDSDNLYAGGYFTTAGGVSANRIAKWDGSSWSALGSGMNGPNSYVLALLMDGSGKLYAGGNFTLAGTNVSAYLAKAVVGDVPLVSIFGTNGAVVASGDSPSLAKGTDLGPVAVGQSHGHTLVITNGGTTNLTISSVSTSGTSAAYFTLTGLPTNLPAGNSSNIVVTFSPSAAVSSTATFSIVNNSAVTPFVLHVAGTGFVDTSSFTLRGTNGVAVTSGEAASTAKGSDFGSRSWSSVWTNVFVLTNATDNALAISGVTTSGSGAVYFEIAGLPSSLAAHQSASVPVVFRADVPGVHTAAVSIANDSPVNPFVLNLRGRTLAPPSIGALGTNAADIASGESASAAKGTVFGTAAVGVSRTNTLRIVNSGEESLTISGVTTSGTGATSFRLLNLPSSVAALSTSTFQLVCAPLQAGTLDAAFAIAGNATNSPFTLNVQGSAYALSQSIGPSAGGTILTITNGLLGSGSDITNVLVGGSSAAIQAQGANWVRVVVPAGSVGTVSVVVQSASLGQTTFASVYTYRPAGVIGFTTTTQGGGTGSWTQVASMPAGRAGVDAGTLGSYIYAIASSDSPYSQDTFRFDGTTWTTLGATVPAGRYAPGSAVLGGYFYCIGGQDTIYRDSAYRFDGSAWTTVASLPTPRGRTAAGTLNGAVYAVGGYGSGYMSSVDRFDGSSWTAAASLPQARLHHAVATLNGSLYAIGGFDSSWAARTNVYRFDGTNWTEVAGLPAARTLVAADVVSNVLYVVGGANSGWTAQSDVYRFDGTSWTTETSLPGPRAEMGVAVLNGVLYAMGGSSSADVFRFTPGSQSIATTNLGVSPVTSPGTGGVTVTISGSNLCNGTVGDVTAVTLCGITASVSSVSSHTQIVVVAGNAGGGIVSGHVAVVSSEYGTTTKSNVFTYLNPALLVLGTNGAVIVNGEAASLAKGSDFGVLTQGMSRTRAFVLTNTSASAIDLGNLVIAGPGQTAFSWASSRPTSVPAGGTGTLNIQFQPASAGNFTAYVNITNNSPVSPYVLNLAGSRTIADQVISFPVISAQVSTNKVGLAATASSGLLVSFSVLNGPASISGGTNLAFSGAGTVSIVASQAGDSSWNPAPDVTNTFHVCTLSVSSGPFAGGNSVIISNGSFGTITNVLVGGVAATGFSQGGDSWVTVTLPFIGTVGPVDLVVQAVGGTMTLAGAYTVNPAGVIPDAHSVGSLPALITLSSTWLDGTNGIILAGAQTNDRSGRSVSSAGDVNGDGLADILVGAEYAKPSGRVAAGETYLIYGRSNGLPASIVMTNSWLDGTNGIILAGAKANDLSGGSVSSAGDVNGDGLADLLVGAMYAAPSGRAYAGEAYLVYGRSNGLPALITLTNTWLDGTNGNILAGARASDFIGRSVSSAGDVNGDGLADLLVGADQESSLEGRTYLLYGRSNGYPALIMLTNTWLDGTNGIIIAGANPSQASGFSVSSAGDVNGDGLADLLVGAPLNDSEGLQDAGKTYLVYGRSNGLPASIVLTSEWLNGTNGIVLAGARTFDESGYSVSSAGDVNGDGLADLLIGAYKADPSGRFQAGETYLVYGRSSGLPSLITLTNTWLDGTNGVLLAGTKTEDYCGYSVKSAGDVNGDGLADLLVGAHQADPSGRREAGETYLVYGRSNGLPSLITLTNTWLDGTNGVLLAGATTNDRSGYAVNSAGDVNGDGLADLLVGAYQADPPGRLNAGETYLVYGRKPTWELPVSPSAGSCTGGYQVVIIGSNLGDGSDVTGVTLGGVSASIQSQSATQLVVLAGAGAAGLGDVRIYSTSYGETVKSNAFTYLRASQAGLVFTPITPQAYLSTNALSVSGGSGTGAVSYTVLSGPGLLVSGTNLVVTSGSGTIAVRATKAQDDLYYESSVTALVMVAKAEQVISFPAISSQLTTNQVGLAASASSGFSVSFSVFSGPASLSDGTNLSFTGVGDVLVVAAQAGDASYEPAPDVTNVVKVFSVTPDNGPYAGGNLITVSNGNFGTITNVLLGGTGVIPADSGANWFSLVVPSLGSAGVKDVVVQTDGGAITLAEAYTVHPSGLIGGSTPGPYIWTNVGSGMNAEIIALAQQGGNLYAGGVFTNAGGVAASYVARWDGSTWTSVGGGVDTSVWALVQHGGQLYAGGKFTSAGGVSANRIAMWNGVSWTNLGSGFDSDVIALAHDGNNLYAGGSFTNAGGVTASQVAMWNGTSWTNLGSGMNRFGYVYALAHDGTNLYAGGIFTNAGGVNVNQIALWNGTSWTNLGSGMNPYGTVRTLLCAGGLLYAGGGFTNAGGVTVNRIAAWNGVTWMNLGSGMDNSQVSALAHEGTDLYAGGSFTTVGGMSANRVAMWNGSSWTNLGSGMTSFQVSALAQDGARLYAGGDFTTAGGLPANRVAMWAPSNVPFTGVEPASGSWTGGYPVVIRGSNLGNGGDVTNVTLCGLSASIQSQSATQVIVLAAAGVPGVGDVRVYSSSYGETVRAGSFTYTKESQVITFPAIPDQVQSNKVGLAATASSGLPASFAVRSGFASISGGTNLSFSFAGVVRIAASQSGNAFYEPAIPVTNTFRVWGLYGLTISSARGTAVPPVGAYTNVEGTVLTNSVGTPVAGGSLTQYVCTGWTMTGNEPSSGITNTMAMTLTNYATLTWTWQTNAWLDVSAWPHGAVTGSGWYRLGGSVTVTAVAHSGHAFTGWRGDVPAGQQNANPLTLTLDRARSLQATFITTYYVAESGSDANSGLSWILPKRSLQSALDATYHEDAVVASNGSFNAIEVLNRVAVRSANGAAFSAISGAAGLRAVYLSSNATLTGFTVTGAVVSVNGAGVFAEPGATVSRCVIRGNTTTADGGGAYGGTLVNCVLSGNAAANGSGAAQAALTHCTVARNVASGSGAAYQCTSLNSIIYENTGGNVVGGAATYSCLIPDVGGTGNTTNDPIFAHSEGGDFHVLFSSPCIDAGSAAGVTIDLDGTPRPQPATYGGTPGYELGAYEYYPLARFVWTNGTHTAPFDTWARAATNVQAALDHSIGGDQIVVGNGRYGSFVVTNAVILKSLNGPANTIIDAGGNGRAVTLNAPAVLDGFGVENGAASDCGGIMADGGAFITNCVIRNNQAAGQGGGLCLFGESVAVACRIESNRALNAAGVYAQTGSVAGTTIRGNAGTGGYGGGAELAEDAEMIRCTVEANTNQVGGGIHLSGGAIRGCTIAWNRALTDGGGVSVEDGFAESCLLHHNRAETNGGGLYMPVTGQVFNLTIADNQGAVGGGAYLSGTAAFWNGIVVSNEVDNVFVGGSAAVRYSMTSPQASGEGNQLADPRFLATNDYHLTGLSSAIDAGSNQTWTATSLDLDGQVRRYGPRVDLGADEAVLEAVGCQRTGALFRLQWNATKDAAHQFQVATNSPASGWEDYGSIFTANQPVVTLDYTNPAATRASFRLLWMK